MRVAAAAGSGDKGDAAAASAKKKGFGSSSPAPAAAGAAPVGTHDGKSAPSGGFWTDVGCTVAELQTKPVKPVILAGNKAAVCIFLVNGVIYSTAGVSTTYQYPMFDADVFDQDGKPAIRCKLDGTSYELATGRVIEWCPKEDSPLSLRNVFATLKAASAPVPLAVYPTRITKTGKVEILYK